MNSGLDQFESGTELPATHHQVVIGLEPEEEPWRQAKIARQPKVGISGDGTLAEHDLIERALIEISRHCEEP